MRCPAYSLPTGRLRHLPTAANHFVKAQATMFHFPQAENSSCSLAFPLPAKQALRGPIIASAPGGAPIAPRCQSVTDTSRYRQYVACARMGAALLLEVFYFGVLPASNFRLSRCFSNASINRRGRCPHRPDSTMLCICNRFRRIRIPTQRADVGIRPYDVMR